MPEEAIVAIGSYLAESAATAEIGSFLITYAGTISTVATIAAVYSVRDGQRRAQNRAKDAYNASLRDRYTMLRGALEQRQLVLGRARVSGPMFYVGSYGAMREHLVFAVALAGHEIDAVEAVYFDDERVVLDGSGNVTGINRRETFTISGASATFAVTAPPNAGSVSAVAEYGSDSVPLTVGSVSGTSVPVSGARASETGLVTITYQPPNPYAVDEPTLKLSSTTGTGSPQTVALDGPPVGGVVQIIERTGSGVDVVETQVTSYTVAGNSVTFTATAGVAVSVNYQWSHGVSRARVRSYRGTATQTADAGMMAAMPGQWTSAHRARGVAYLVVEFDYDPDAFPAGIPNVSALIRGDNQCFDPRTGTTGWSDNPALLTRRYAVHPLGARMSAAQVNDTAIMAAANVCDSSATYTVGGKRFTRALYKAGGVYRADARPADALNDLTQAMGGRWLFSDGVLRVVAGAYSAPVMSLDESWLTTAGGVQIVPRRARPDVVNVITGSFADETRDYQELNFPRVAADAYIAEDGKELPTPLRLGAVQWTGQAQYIAACQLRYGRQGLTIKLTCNMRAYPAEAFDPISVNLARYGWVNKPFEVLDTSFTLDGLIELTLKETDASIWQMDAGFPAQDPAPNTRLPNPFGVPKITGLACASGTAQLMRKKDGTIVSRIKASWSTLGDATVNAGGQVEVRYGQAATNPSTWASVYVPGDVQEAMLPDVEDGKLYLVMARGLAPLATGAWTLPVLHQVVGKTQAPSPVAGLTATAIPGGFIRLKWTAGTDADEAGVDLGRGSSWVAAVGLEGQVDKSFAGGRGANSYDWAWPAPGGYTVRARRRDTSGNLSTEATLAITVTAAGVAIDTVQIGDNAVDEIYQDSTDFAGAGFATGTVRTFTITPAHDALIEFTSKVSGDNLLADSGYQVQWYAQAGSGSDVFLGGGGGPNNDKRDVLAVNSLTAAAGVPITFKLKTIRPAGAPTQIHIWESSMRMGVIYK